MKVAIRADADLRVGFGHVSRCLSLAEALVSLGCSVRLVSANALPGVLQGRAASMASLAVLQRGADDADAFVDALRGFSPDWVVVDHYGIDSNWHESVRARLGSKICVIDDLANRSLACDLLLDHNPSEDHAAKYRSRLVRPARILGGLHFCLVSRSYVGTPITGGRELADPVGVFVGGSDPLNLSAKIVELLRRDLSYTAAIEVVSTSANPSLDALREACSRFGAVLSVDQPDLAEFYRRNAVHVGAGGGAAWERCAMGVPSLVLQIAGNQRPVVDALRSAGAAICVSAENGTEGLDAVRLELGRLLRDQWLRSAIGEAARKLVDGEGALRSAVALTLGSLKLRDAKMDDADVMHQWRNHPAVRAVSRSQEAVRLDEHVDWLRAALARDDRHVLVAEVGARPVGIIRYDRVREGLLEVSLYSDPVLRGTGIGSAMLTLGERYVLGRYGAPLAVQAFVLGGNDASLRMFTRAGFTSAGDLLVKQVTDRPARQSRPEPEGEE